MDFPDLQGNTPLHYAAKEDHLDLCRILVDRGAFAGKKNDQGMSAYDIAKSHTVRQYLLPLQFQNERQHTGGAGLCNGCDDIYCRSPGHMLRSSNYLMASQSQSQAQGQTQGQTQGQSSVQIEQYDNERQ